MKTITSLISCTLFFGAMMLAQSNPVPEINQPLIPASVAPGSADFTLTVDGAGFNSTSSVNWNGAPLATTFLNSSQLTAIVPASTVTTGGTASVTVVNPQPGGGTSNAEFFSIRVPFSAVSFGSSLLDAGIGTNAREVVSADLDGDGNLDLATINDLSSGGSVSVLLGTGDGNFQAPVQYSVSFFPAALAVGDFNRDGKLDLVFTGLEESGNVLSILLGNGDGTFQAQQESPLASASYYRMVVGDFDRDGNLDLAITETSPSAEVLVLLGNGDGTFQVPVSYSVGTSEAGGVAVADLNGDGLLDLAVSAFSDSGVTILLGNGDGTFQTALAYPTAAFPNDLVVADFDGDEKLDLAVNVTQAFSVLLGNGDGTFRSHVDYKTPATGAAIAVADLNGDNKLDVVVDGNGFSIATHVGNGDGTFEPPNRFPTTGSSKGMALGDFDSDGRLDLAIPVSATVNLLPQVTSVLSKTFVNFGTVTVHSVTSVNVALSNIGDSALTINAIKLNPKDAPNFAENDDCGTTLQPGSTCTIKVLFKPIAKGKFKTFVTVSDSVSKHVQTLALEGTAN
jgi:hypothetical protein